MGLLSTFFHPIIYTAVLFLLPMAVYMRMHDTPPIHDWHEVAIACLYFALASTVFYGARRDYLKSKMLRAYMVVQYIAITQFVVVLSFEMTLPDTWMLMTLLFAMPAMFVIITVSSVSYIIHRVRRARKSGTILTRGDVEGNVTILGVLALIVCAGIILSQWS